jgi:hypothetical protein
MPWHQSRSDPRKVYDHRHETVCVCMNADQAALIVRGVNALPGSAVDTFIKLREPEPAKPQFTHVTAQADGCCAKHIAKASLSGALDRMQPWACPKCGTTYWPRQEGPVVNWEARAAVMVFKP